MYTENRVRSASVMMKMCNVSVQYLYYSYWFHLFAVEVEIHETDRIRFLFKTIKICSLEICKKIWRISLRLFKIWDYCVRWRCQIWCFLQEHFYCSRTMAKLLFLIFKQFFENKNVSQFSCFQSMFDTQLTFIDEIY